MSAIEEFDKPLPARLRGAVPAPVKQSLRAGGGRAAGVALLLAAFAGAVALGGYDPRDESIFVANGGAVSNFLGPVGANFAVALIWPLGHVAWFALLLLAGWGWRLAANTVPEDWPLRLAVGLFAGVFLAAFASALNWGWGGLVGDRLFYTMLMLFGPLVPGSPFLLPGLLMGVLGVAASIYAAGIGWRATRAVAGKLGGQNLQALQLGARGLKAAGAAAVGAMGAVGSGLPVSMPSLPSLPLRTFRRDGGEAHRGDGVMRVDRRSSTARNVIQRAGDPAPEVQSGPREIGLGADKRDGAMAAIRRSTRAGARQDTATALSEMRAANNDEGGYAGRPPLGLLAPPPKPDTDFAVSDEDLRGQAETLRTVLEEYGVRGKVDASRRGPVVTLHEFAPEAGIKAARVIGLSDDIARSMKALSARVSAIPGRVEMGVELRTVRSEHVSLRDMLESAAFSGARAKLPLALGKDIGGAPVVVDLASMPHLLIAGTTGSGKSVAINTMILSLLYKHSPQDCRMIMIDPKMLELSVYDGIPHLLAPVVIDPSKAVRALKWVVREMERRYQIMSKLGVRNLETYNARALEAAQSGGDLRRNVQSGFDSAGQPVYEMVTIPAEKLPLIVVVVDEMADLMMVAGKDVEIQIQRLAQMARASGIHIIMATQRPSVDVITGTIKANFPTRVSFQVTSKIDSRTILGEQGAEQLLGKGDMLLMEGGGRIRRVHGPFVSDGEVEQIADHLRRSGRPNYAIDFNDMDDSELDELLGGGEEDAGGGNSEDALYDRAVRIVSRDRKASISYVQRQLQIGYNKAARLVERMGKEGVVSQADRVGKRQVLVGGQD